MGAFRTIERCLQAGGALVVAYLTDGGARGVPPALRNAESLQVLGQLGVRPDQVHFLGTELDVPDGHLVSHLETVYRRLLTLRPTTIYTTAWEGGHPDHDAAALLAVALGRTLGIADDVWQFSLYNAVRWPLLSVFHPIAAAGLIHRERIPPRRRLAYLASLARYRS